MVQHFVPTILVHDGPFDCDAVVRLGAALDALACDDTEVEYVEAVIAARDGVPAVRIEWATRHGTAVEQQSAPNVCDAIDRCVAELATALRDGARLVRPV